MEKAAADTTARALSADLEKGGAAPTEVSPTASTTAATTALDNEGGITTSAAKQNPLRARLGQWNTRIESLSGFEARGIARVGPAERQPESRLADLQMLLLWFSANISVNNLTVGLLGPLLFGLGFVDSALCAVFGCALGAVGTAYMSIWGARSGCRTMVGFFFC